MGINLKKGIIGFFNIQKFKIVFTFLLLWAPVDKELLKSYLSKTCILVLLSSTAKLIGIFWVLFIVTEEPMDNDPLSG